MAEQQNFQPPEREPATPDHIVQFLIAEQTSLATIRSGTIFESSGRTTLYLTTVSSGVLALSFIGQMSELGTAFFAFALILFPAVLFIGVVTFARVLQTAVEDGISALGMARIRHYMMETAPHIKPYFVGATNDDIAAMQKSLGANRGSWQLFLTTAGMVSVVNSLIVGVLVGLVALMLSAAVVITVVIGMVVFIVSMVLHTRYQIARWRVVDRDFPPLFPSPDAKPE